MKKGADNRLNRSGITAALRRATGLLALLLFFISGLNAQERPRSDQQWLSLSAGWKFSKKWELNVTEMLRLQNGFSTYKLLYTDFCITRKIKKYLYLSAGYRFIQRAEERNHRFYADVTGKIYKKWGKFGFTLSPRLRLQDQFTGRMQDRHIRTKLKLAMERKKLPFKPWLSYEWYWEMNPDFMGLSRTRLSGGADFPLSKKWDMGIAYILQTPYRSTYPAIVHIASLSFDYSF